MQLSVRGIAASLVVLMFSSCNPFGSLGNMSEMKMEAKAPYKETATKQPCPGETVDQKCQAYVDCAPSKCDSAYKQCLGDGYKDGNFGGACKTFMECGKACGNVCSEQCTCMPDQPCTDCMKNTLVSCVLTQCVNELYTCAGLQAPREGGACTQLTACCATLDASGKKDCESAASTAKLGGDATCQTVLSTYQSSGKCKVTDGPTPTTCSTQGGAATYITFKNKSTDKTYVTYWIDFKCKEMEYEKILPGGSARQMTFVGHPWRIRDSSGKFVKDVPGNTSATETTVEIP